MDFDQSPFTIENFNTLTEDLQARILYSGVGGLNKRYSELSIQDRIHQASTRPYTQDDVLWLISVRKNILIFMEGSGRVFIEIFSIPTYFKDVMMPIPSDLTCQVDDLWIEPIRGRVNYSYNVGEEPLEYIPERLINRFDPTIIPEGTSRYGGIIDESDNNIVFTDVRSIFLIFRKRMEIIVGNQKQSTELARRATIQVFNTIVDSYQEKRLPALLGYLVLNAILLEIELVTSYYLHNDTRTITPEYLQEVENKCAILYKNIVEQISYMR